MSEQQHGARIDSFLRLVTEQGASDLHFHSGNVPIIRHDGQLVTLPFRPLSAEETRRFLFEIMTPAQRAQFERTQELDFAYAVEGVGRFRANVFVQAHGMSAVFRVVPSNVPTIEQLSLPPVLKKLAALESGLVLVSGPTGHGKTTTLSAMVHEINARSQRHIVTLEDPIEFVHKNLRSVVTQRQIGLHSESFSAALRSALRESPDVIVVGELRDPESAMLALSAAETGMLVFATVHTNSAAKSIDRLVDMCPEAAQAQVRSTLATTLRAVLAQQLVKLAGERGRVAATEVLLWSHALANMIRENRTFQVDAQIFPTQPEGSETQSLDVALAGLVRKGLITPEEALRVARNPDTFKV
jgi:twitching motility protein PilT